MIIRFHWCYIGLALNTFNNHHCRTWKSLIAHVTRDYQIHNLFMHHDGELVNHQRKCSCSREIWRSSVHRCETQCQTLIRLFRSQSQWTTFLWFIANRSADNIGKKLKKKREESFLFLAAEFQSFFPFSSHSNTESRYGYPWKFIWNYVPVYLRIERKRWRLFDVPFPEIGFNLRPERVNELFLLSFHTNCPPRSFPFVFQRSYVSYSHNRFSRFHF